MKLIKATAMLGMAVAAATLSQQALAQDVLGWYGGASLGVTKATIDDARISSGLLGSGFATTGIDDHDRDKGYKIFGGYQMNRNFAIEGGYYDLGKFSFDARTLPLGTLHGEGRMRGLNLDLVGTLPLTDKFSAFARIGVANTLTRDKFSSTGAVLVTNPNPSKRQSNLKLGAGLQYAFSDRFSVRGEFERYRVNDAVGNRGDIDQISIGLIYRFGADNVRPVSAKAAAPVAMMPAPAPAPTPAPVIAVAPVPPPPAPVAVPRVLRQVTFSADSLFDFDKVQVRPAARQELDKFVTELAGLNYVQISVAGHTDRLGSADYNTRLSQRRADAVKAYLVERGAPADKLLTRAAGESEPVTKPGDCVGNTASRALIACLQPDRRVDVQVKGTD